MNGLELLSHISLTNFVALVQAGDSKILAFDGATAIEVFIHIATVLMLFGILAKILWNPVREILRKREEGIAKEYNEIEQTKTQLNAVKAEYESKLANIEQEATEILEKARKLSLKQENKILKEAKDEADEIKQLAAIEIERAKIAAKDAVRKEIVEVATLMAGKFVETSLDEATKVAMLDKTIDEMGEDTWLN